MLLLLTKELKVAPHIGIMLAMPHEAVHVHEVGDGKDKYRDQQGHN